MRDIATTLDEYLAPPRAHGMSSNPILAYRKRKAAAAAVRPVPVCRECGSTSHSRSAPTPRSAAQMPNEGHAAGSPYSRKCYG